MGLIGLAIGKANVKIKEKRVKKIRDKGDTSQKYEEAKEKLQKAKKRFGKYKEFEQTVWLGIPAVFLYEVPVLIFESIKGVQENIKQQKQLNKQYKPEKEITEACAKMVENATGMSVMTPETLDGSNRSKLARELLLLNGLNPNSIATIFGKSIQHIAVLNDKANFLLVCYKDENSKPHYAFLEKNLETGNFYQFADLTSEKAQQRIKEAIEILNAKLKKREKNACISTASKLTSKERQ